MSNLLQEDPLKVDDLLLDLKRRKLELSHRKEKIYRENKLALFVPHAKQMLFYEAIDRRVRGVFTGNQWGKTTAGCAESCSWLLGYRPFFPEGHPLRTKGIPSAGVQGLVIGEKWDKVRELFTQPRGKSDRPGLFFDFLPDWSIEDHESKQGVIYIIYVKSELNGRIRKSAVHFDTVESYRRESQSQESSVWDFVHYDEPVIEDMWVAHARGLMARSGKTWWLGTPLKYPWMYDHVLENAGKNPEEYWMHKGPTDENPTLTEKNKTFYFSQIENRDELECRRLGTPLAYGRLVYSGYNESIHLMEHTPAGWSSPLKPSKDYMICYAIDTHPQTPHAVLFIAVSPTWIIIYNEIFEKITRNYKVKDLGEAVLETLGDSYVGYGLLEPAAYIEDAETGQCYADDFYDVGLSLQPAK